MTHERLHLSIFIRLGIAALLASAAGLVAADTQDRAGARETPTIIVNNDIGRSRDGEGTAAGEECEPAWSNLGAGMSGGTGAWALTVFDDDSGGGPALYAGGNFTIAGGDSANNIAKWNGSEWSTLGDGMNHWVRALTVFDDGSGPALYAVGDFWVAGGVPDTSRIARWNGTTWSALGSGINSSVYALTVFDDGSGPALYAGGVFTAAGGVPASRIAKWSGTAWSALGSGMAGPDPWVSALAVFDDGSGPALYAGGNFTIAGDATVNRIAKWNGSTWSALGSGMTGSPVYALTVFDDGSGPALYAGGNFASAGGVPDTSRIARWDGTEWSSVGGGMSGNEVRALTVFDDGSGPALFAGGNFSSAGGVPNTGRIAKWDGTAWSPLTESGMNGGVVALTVFDDDSGGGPALYASGGFTMAGGVSANYIAKWQGCPDEPECAPADLNCDGHVDVQDLLMLLSSWGPCPKEGDCPADLNNSGAVDVQDLLILLANWG